jgi:hypothetical protein
MMTAAAAQAGPGHGFGDFVLVALVVGFLIVMVRDLRAHSAAADDAAESAATTAVTAGPAGEPARSRAARRARMSFRRFRQHGWFRRRVAPGKHGGATPKSVAGDGLATAFAVFAYAAGFTAGLAHAKTPPAAPTSPRPTAPASEPAGSPKASDPAAPQGTAKPTHPARSKRRRMYGLTGWLRRKPVEGEVVDPEPARPVPAIATVADQDVIDAVPLEDTDGTTDPDEPQADNPAPEPRTQGAPPMAFIQTIHELFSWAKGALAAADTRAAEAEMRAKVAAGRAEDAAAVAQTAADDAATLSDVYTYWSTQNMDRASLDSIGDSMQSAYTVRTAENHRAECEAASAQANLRSVAAIRSHQEDLATMAATVKARQMQHAEAQRDTGNAAAHASVLEGA